MSLSTPNDLVLTNPKLFDEAFAEIAAQLEIKLSAWPLRAFGRCQKLVEQKDRQRRYYPAWFFGQNQDNYLKLFPDQSIRNFSFFTLEDGQDIPEYPNTYQSLKGEFGLVFWFYFPDIFGANWQNYSIDNVKNEILHHIQRIRTSNFEFHINRIWEEADNIYKGFNHSELDCQFLMRPYGGFRIDGEITVRNCGTIYSPGTRLLPNCEIIVQSVFANESAASDLTDGQYFALGQGNTEGAPTGTIVQKGASTTYISESAAQLGGVSSASCFALDQVNIYGGVQNQIRVVAQNGFQRFNSDTEAASAGIQINDIYVIGDAHNEGSIAWTLKQRIK